MNESTKITDTKLTPSLKAAIKEHFPYAVTLGDLKQCISDDPTTLDCFTPRTVDIIMNILDFTDYDGAVSEPPATKQETALADAVKHAYDVHAQIILGAKMVENGLYQMAKGFKAMRDEKLYKELGYDTFEKYCEVETGIKRRQVYNYISIAEKLPADFVQSTAQIGSEKLRLLTTLTDDQREEIAENTDLEQTSVKELQRKIKELTADVEDLTIENDRLEKENQSLTFDNTNLEEERDDLIRQNNELMTRQPIVTGGIVTGGYDPEQLKEFFEDYYEAAHKAVRAVYIFVREDYPQEIKNYVRNRVNDLRNYIEDLEDIHEDDF